jgi:hypothetical protein
VFTTRPDGYGTLVSQYYTGVNAWRYYHFDGLGSTVQLTTVNETESNLLSYDAYGNQLSSPDVQPAFTYIGQLGYYSDWHDAQVVDYYIRQRT